MTPSQAAKILEKIQHTDEKTGEVTGLFPNATITPEEKQLLGERLVRIDIDEAQAVAVLEQYRMSVSGPYSNKPDFPKLLAAMYQAMRSRPRENYGAPNRNLLVDVYRRRFPATARMSDVDTALYVADSVITSWGIDGARNHLREMLREFMTDDVEVWRIVFGKYPNEAMQARERERVKRIRDRTKEYEAKKNKAVAGE